MRVVVIGAGILGSSVAYHLALNGIEVEMIDEVHQGKATLAGAGIVCPWATKVDRSAMVRALCGRGALLRGLVEGLIARGEDRSRIRARRRAHRGRELD